jgi:hypothetical protein
MNIVISSNVRELEGVLSSIGIECLGMSAVVSNARLETKACKCEVAFRFGRRVSSRR